jgi:hypothetical protein
VSDVELNKKREAGELPPLCCDDDDYDPESGDKCCGGIGCLCDFAEAMGAETLS